MLLNSVVASMCGISTHFVSTIDIEQHAMIFGWYCIYSVNTRSTFFRTIFESLEQAPKHWSCRSYNLCEWICRINLSNSIHHFTFNLTYAMDMLTRIALTYMIQLNTFQPWKTITAYVCIFHRHSCSRLAHWQACCRPSVLRNKHVSVLAWSGK